MKNISSEIEVAAQIPAESAPLGPGMRVMRALPTGKLESVGPFVFFDHLGPIPTPKVGVPPHPHAGIEVISYILEGAIEHRDSFGHSGRVTSGGAQWLSAGRGILHAEKPGADKTPIYHGVQMWTRLPRAADDSAPQYHSVPAESIPEARGDGWKLRLPAGELPPLIPVAGPIHLAQPTLLAHLRLEPGANLTIPVNPAHELAVYILVGEARLGASQTPLPLHTLSLLKSTDTVMLANANETTASELLLFGGQPAERPLVFHGSFVFSTEEDARRAVHDYRAGRMGTLAPE